MSVDESIWLLISAIIWDLLFGEVRTAVHPVVWMGRLIRFLEARIFRQGQSPTHQLLMGCLILLCCVMGSCSFNIIVIDVLDFSPWLSFIWQVFMLKSCFALNELGKAAYRVKEALSDKSLQKARYELRSLCSRDASYLSQEELVSATCSSLGENLSDSVVAPIFYFVCFGVTGAVMFRMVNTLDARIGYRGKYEYFGKASAKVDDILGFIPAKITSLLILISGKFVRSSLRKSLAITLRDAPKTPSPNGGWPMAALAGVLEIQLEKPGCYCLGDAIKELNADRIGQAWRLMGITSGLFFFCVIAYMRLREILFA